MPVAHALMRAVSAPFGIARGAGLSPRGASAPLFDERISSTVRQRDGGTKVLRGLKPAPQALSNGARALETEHLAHAPLPREIPRPKTGARF